MFGQTGPRLTWMLRLTLTLSEVGSHMIKYVNYAEISLHQASANQSGSKRKLNQNYAFPHHNLLWKKPFTPLNTSFRAFYLRFGGNEEKLLHRITNSTMLCSSRKCFQSYNVVVAEELWSEHCECSGSWWVYFKLPPPYHEYLFNIRLLTSHRTPF